MAGERRLNWGADATDAKWRSEHDTANSRFVVAEDLDGGTVVLEIDETAGEVVSRYPVNLSGNNLVDGTTTVYDASSDTVGDGTTSADHASVSTESVANDYYFAAAFDGSNATDRLSNTLSAASDGDTIFLEGGVYGSNLTISTAVTLQSPGREVGGAELHATWTLNGSCIADQLSIDQNNGGNITVGASNCSIQNCRGQGSGEHITVDGSFAEIDGGTNLDVTFNNGATSGVADSLVASNVTDNDGGNVIGDTS